MKNGKYREIIYYSDEENDEFSRAKITPKRIDGNYKYLREGAFSKIAHFFLYRIVFAPIAFFYTKLRLSHNTVGAAALRQCESGYFIYGNHTQDIGDAFMPNMLDFGRDKYFIVHPNNVSMRFLGRMTPYLGALPLPDDLVAARNFSSAVKHHIERGRAVVIYPEAHIWPFYTGIRPFGKEAFIYPVRYGVPAYCFTNVYKKRGRGFRIETYVDGPFFANAEIPRAAAAAELCEKIYSVMNERAKLSDVQIIKYVKKEKDNDRYR